MTTSFIARAAAIATFTGVSFAANGQARPNDTGVMQAYGSGGLWPCNATNTGDASAFPRQDCRFGRDAMADAGTLSKTGGGTAGFDWTPLDAGGQTIAIQNGIPAATPTCVIDNVTQLMWEVKSQSGSSSRSSGLTYYWYDSNVSTNGGVSGTNAGASDTSCNGIGCDSEKFVAHVNASGLCGRDGWRLPTRRELLSIVQNGRADTGQFDLSFFPNSVAGSYWSAETYRGNPDYAWSVAAGSSADDKLGRWNGNLNPYLYVRNYVRVVRNATQ